MNTDQIKLSKSEWQSIEIPLNNIEINIIKFIYNSYNNVNINNRSNRIRITNTTDNSKQLIINK